MKVIYKYILNPGGITTLEGYFDQFLDAQVQDGNLVIWCVVNPYDKENGNIMPKNGKKNKFKFTCIGTGWPYQEEGIGDYCATVQMPDGLVWHIFVNY